MNIDIVRLNNDIDKNILIDTTYSFSKEEMEGTDLLKLDNVKIVGELHKNVLGNIVLSAEVSGVMVLPCAITLKPVNYPFSLIIDDEIEKLYENIEEKTTNLQNTIDILPIIWENILMEIPTRVVSPDADISNLSGDGWRVITDEEESVNAELSKLNDLLKTSEVS